MPDIVVLTGIGVTMLLVICWQNYGIRTGIADVVKHTNSMKDALVKVTGEAELARGKLLGKQEAGLNPEELNKDWGEQIDRVSNAVVDRIGDLLIQRLLKDDRFKAKEKT